MGLSRDDAKQMLVALLPPGSEQLYALRNTDYIGGTFYGLAKTIKEYGTDRVDQLRLEVNPSTIVEKIPDWEEACGLVNTPIARFGTIAQRRNAILGVLREHSSFSLADVRAAVQPFLLYANPEDIEILETDRVLLQAAHTYTNSTPLVVPPLTLAESTITVLDDPRVSPAGAIANIDYTGDFSDSQFSLVGPSGGFAIKTWYPGDFGTGPVVNGIRTLFAREMAGFPIRGNWKISCNSVSGGTLNSWSLFVEGLGVNFDTAIPPNRIGQGLGSAIYEFVVIVDMTKVGTGYDLGGLYKAIQKVKPAHVLGNYVVKNTIAGLCAIPDEPETIPDRSIPC